MSESAKPRDLFGLLVDSLSRLRTSLRWILRPYADTWRLVRHQRNDIETSVAFCALTGSRSQKRAAVIMLIAVILVAGLSEIARSLRLRALAIGVQDFALMELMTGDFGWIIVFLFNVVGIVTHGYFWTGLLCSLMILRFIRSHAWRTELKAVPWPSGGIGIRITMLMLLSGCLFHVFAQIAHMTSLYLIVIRPFPPEDRWLMWHIVLLDSNLYAENIRPRILEVMIFEPIARLDALLKGVLDFALAALLLLYARGILRALPLLVALSLFIWLLSPIGVALRATTRNLALELLDDQSAHVAAGLLNQCTSILFLLLTLGLLCRLIERRIIQLMEE